ncbi:MAG TPA: hypothetical protein VKR99_08360 [Candidatus Eremiobacteraceae bacterium]|nr:hypothetical protein [Candidatus Eremiobacteraceae bacterium]
MPQSDAQLVFICAANACRSAIAQVIASAEAQRRGMPLRVASAGTHALPGYRAATIAQATMNEIGLSLDQHRSQPASGDLVSPATLVVTMTDEQRDMLRSAFKKDAKKILSFNDITGQGDVPDPISGDPDEVRSVRDTLLSAMPEIFATLQKFGDGA